VQKHKQAAAVVGDQYTKAKVLLGSGIVKPYGPRKLAQLVKTLRTWGVGPAGGFASLAVRSPDSVGIVDELGELTWKQVMERATALADSLREMGVDADQGVHEVAVAVAPPEQDAVDHVAVVTVDQVPVDRVLDLHPDGVVDVVVPPELLHHVAGHVPESGTQALGLGAPGGRAHGWSSITASGQVGVSPLHARLPRNTFGTFPISRHSTTEPDRRPTRRTRAYFGRL